MPRMSMIWCSFNKNAKCNIWMISICSIQKINFTVVAVDSINASNMQTWIYLRKWTILYWVSILISLLKQSLKPEYMCNQSLHVCNELNNARRLVNPTLMWWNLALSSCIWVPMRETHSHPSLFNILHLTFPCFELVLLFVWVVILSCGVWISEFWV